MNFRQYFDESDYLFINSCLQGDNQVTKNQKVHGHKYFAVCEKMEAT